jgi:hypothetical protein
MAESCYRPSPVIKDHGRQRPVRCTATAPEQVGNTRFSRGNVPLDLGCIARFLLHYVHKFDTALDQLAQLIDVKFRSRGQQQGTVGTAHGLRQARTGFETQG